MEFEHKPSIHVIIQYYVQQAQKLVPFWDVPRISQSRSFSFYSHWINEGILIAIILNEGGTVLEFLLPF